METSNWQTICKFDDLLEGRGNEAFVNGRPIALFLYLDKVYALDDRCPHREGQLSQGTAQNGDAICPLHGWNFDLETGISPYNPNDRIATYPVRVVDGNVEVDASAVPALPASTFDGYQGRWRRWSDDVRGKAEIRKLAKGKSPAVEAMGAQARNPGPVVDFDHFHLRAAQLARFPKLADEAVDTSVTLAPGAGKPLRLALPAYVSHMSFGSLSREAKIALAKGAAMAGTMTCSGEGGMLPEERAVASLYVMEMASGYFGWNDDSMSKADAFEIKLGQSAKPGLGGELPAAKVTEEIAKVRGIKPGTGAKSPARFPDLADLDAFAERISSLRQRYPDKPIGIKLTANDIQGDVEAALSLEPDYITIDGFGGGTGAAPVHVRDEVGMPLLMALPIARQLIDAHNDASSRPVSLVATGGVRTPADVMKAIALGADACALATAALFALGCEYYRACNSGNCPVGIATQTPELRERVDGDIAAERVENFFNGTRKMLEDYLRILGHADFTSVSSDDLVALTPAAAALLQNGRIN